MYSEDLKNKAKNLRISGKSYSEISLLLNISKGTISEWFSNEKWSQTIKNQLIQSANTKSGFKMQELNKIRGKKLDVLYAKAKQEALEELEILKYNPLFIAGIMLYWGEGDKRNKNNVKFINTNPEMIVLYCEFLRIICNVPETKIKAGLFIYEDIDEKQTILFWSQKLQINISNFHKTITLVSRSSKRRTPTGICLITVSSSFLKKKIITWMENLHLKLLDKSYYNADIN